MYQESKKAQMKRGLKTVLIVMPIVFIIMFLILTFFIQK